MTSRKSVAEIINERDAKRAQGHWRPASGGTEKPFTTRTGRRLLYVHQSSTGKSAYLDMDTDIILSQRDAEFAIGLGDAGLGVTAADRERWGWFPPVGTRVRYTKEKEENRYGIPTSRTPWLGEEGSFIRTRKGVGYTLWDVEWDESGKLMVSPVGGVEVIVDSDLGDAGWPGHSILIKTKQYNTDTGSARVKAWVTREGSTKTNSIPYPYEMNTTERHMAAAVALVKKLGWDGRFDQDGPRQGPTPGTLVHVFVHAYP